MQEKEGRCGGDEEGEEEEGNIIIVGKHCLGKN